MLVTKRWMKSIESVFIHCCCWLFVGTYASAQGSTSAQGDQGTKSCQNILIIDFDYQENKSCIKQCASHCSQDHQYLWKETVLIHCSRLFKGTWSDTQGWPGNKKLSISLATNSLLANLNMLEANCDHPSLVVLTITSHKALGAESLLFFFDEAGSWFTFRLVLGRMKSFWVERPRTGALRHWPL